MIKNIKIENFKSFEQIETTLDRFNVVVGANASGKTNFIKAFEFLRDITKWGLENAISMQGGIEYLRNITVGSTRDFYIESIWDPGIHLLIETETKKELTGLKIFEVIHKFGIKFTKNGFKYKIIEDKLIQKCDFVKLLKSKNKIEEKEKIGSGEIIIYLENGELFFDIKKPKEISINEGNIVPPFLKEKKMQPNTTLLTLPIFLFSPLEESFNNISIFDFDPKLPKKATPITGKAELEEDGSNLSLILKNIIQNKDNKRKIYNLMNDLMPFISDLGVERFADKSLLFKLKEVYSNEQYLPASLISDGTISITALIVSLYFEQKMLNIIEEPERNIHPHLIAKVINMMKDASKSKQIIVTTHSPEVVKNADLENILLISRNKRGFSTIEKPGERKDVLTFLKNEVGIEELYVQNLLEE
jgi:predicted ATPase